MSHRLDLVHELCICAAAGVPVCWVLDLAVCEVVVHTRPSAGSEGSGTGVARYAHVERLPWTAPLAVHVDGTVLEPVLAEPLVDLG